MVIIERPYQYNWSKNSIRYVFKLTSAGANKSAQLKIMYTDAFGSTYAELITLSDLIPDSNNLIYVYLQAFLDSLLSFDVPDLTQNIFPAVNQAKKFYVQYREVNDSDTNPDWEDSESAHECIVIKGGIEKLKHSGNNFFKNYFETEKPFITWLPSNRFVYINQKAFISFLNINGGSSDFVVNFSFVDVAGATYTLTRNITGNAIVFHLDVSATQTGFPAFTDNLWYYQVQVEDGSGNTLTAAYRLYVEYRPCYEYWDIDWHNSLGGFDGARVMGETTININKRFEETGKGMDVTAWNKPVRNGSLQHIGIVKRNSFKGDIGFQKTKFENEALQDVLLSTSIYQLIEGVAPDYVWLPVLNLQQSQDLRTSRSKIFSFPIEWQLASEDEVFTPMRKTFGIGESTDIEGLVAADDHYTFTPGTHTVEEEDGVLANDTSLAGGLTVSGTHSGIPIHIATSEGGDVVMFADGNFTYYPPSEEFTGSDSCEYTITDDSGQVSTAVIYITVE